MQEYYSRIVGQLSGQIIKTCTSCS